MRHRILDEINREWNGSGFGRAGTGIVIETLPQLNEEMPKVVASGYKGRVRVVAEGCATNENPMLEIEL